MNELNRTFCLLGINLINKYNQEGISDREFLEYAIFKIREAKREIVDLS